MIDSCAACLINIWLWKSPACDESPASLVTCSETFHLFQGTEGWRYTIFHCKWHVLVAEHRGLPLWLSHCHLSWTPLCITFHHWPVIAWPKWLECRHCSLPLGWILFLLQVSLKDDRIWVKFMFLVMWNLLKWLYVLGSTLIDCPFILSLGKLSLFHPIKNFLNSLWIKAPWVPLWSHSLHSCPWMLVGSTTTLYLLLWDSVTPTALSEQALCQAAEES